MRTTEIAERFALRLDRSWLSATMAVTYFLTQIVVGVCLVRMANANTLVVSLTLAVMNLTAGLLGIHNISINRALWQLPVVIATACQKAPDLRRA